MAECLLGQNPVSSLGTEDSDGGRVRREEGSHPLLKSAIYAGSGDQPALPTSAHSSAVENAGGGAAAADPTLSFLSSVI